MTVQFNKASMPNPAPLCQSIQFDELATHIIVKPAWIEKYRIGVVVLFEIYLGRHVLVELI